MALFWMELNPINVFYSYRRSEFVSMERFCQDIAPILTDDMIGMDKVESRLWIHFLKQRIPLTDLNQIPPHMRYLQLVLVILKFESNSFGIDPSQSI